MKLTPFRFTGRNRCHSSTRALCAVIGALALSATTSAAQVQNATDAYQECMRNAKAANQACLAELAQMQQASNSRDAACREQAQEQYDTIMSSCPDAQQHPQEHAQCVQKAEGRRAQLISGCDTQLAAEQAAQAAKRAACEKDQATSRRKCCADLKAALERARANGTAGASLPSDAITDEVCLLIEDLADEEETDIMLEFAIESGEDLTAFDSE